MCIVNNIIYHCAPTFLSPDSVCKNSSMRNLSKEYRSYERKQKHRIKAYISEVLNGCALKPYISGSRY